MSDTQAVNHYSAEGPGLSSATAGEEAYFTINTYSPRVHVTIIGPSGELTLPPRITDHTSTTRMVTYIPQKPGHHRIRILLENQMAMPRDLPGSPFSVNVLPRKPDIASGDGLVSATVGMPASFTISSPSMGFFSVCIYSSDGTRIKDSQYSYGLQYPVMFTPKAVGICKIVITRMGVDIPGSPFHCVVSDVPTEKALPGAEEKKQRTDTVFDRAVHAITVSGPGLRSATVNVLTQIVLSPLEYPVQKTCIALLNGCSVPVYLQDDGSRFIKYMPTVTGVHTLSVTFLGVHVPGSPFSIQVLEKVETPEKAETTAKAGTPNTSETPEKAVLPSDNVPVFLPMLNLQDILLSSNLPIHVFDKLVKALLFSNKCASLRLITNNVSGSPESLLRLKSVLKNRIQVFNDSTPRFRAVNSGGMNIFVYTWSAQAKQVFIDYLLELSGDELQNARLAFQESPKSLFTPDTPEKCIELFTHLKCVSETVDDYNVLLACAESGAYQEKNRQFMETRDTAFMAQKKLNSDLYNELISVKESLRLALESVKDSESKIEVLNFFVKGLTGVSAKKDDQNREISASRAIICQERDRLVKQVELLQKDLSEKTTELVSAESNYSDQKPLASDLTKRVITAENTVETLREELEMANAKIQMTSRQRDCYLDERNRYLDQRNSAVSERNLAVTNRDIAMKKLECVTAQIEDALRS